MSDVTVGPPGSGALPTANSIDAINDYVPIYTASSTATQAINRNTLLNLTSNPVGLTDTQTLTNKTLTSPTISGPSLSGTITGTYTIGGTPTFPSSVMTLTGTQTATNKTLTSPTINSPTITNASLTADSISGYTTSNAGTIYGIAVSGGQITNAAIANGTIGSAQIATNGVSGSNLSTSSIYLGSGKNTTDVTATNTAVQITGMSVSVTVPSGGRSVKLTAILPQCYASAGAAGLSIWRGAVVSGTQIGGTAFYNNTSGGGLVNIALDLPSAGSYTYNAGIIGPSGTAHTNGTGGNGILLVELV